MGANSVSSLKFLNFPVDAVHVTYTTLMLFQSIASLPRK